MSTPGGGRRTVKAQLSDLTGALYSGLCNMTPRQRGAAIRALEGLTQTNCSWILYRLRPALLAFVDDASTLRERKARARARKAVG